jgi:DNA replicative helicase MCM subunit Mcm2 (Cdc46/Mcm family)
MMITQMFNFLKKLKPQDLYEIPELSLTLSIRDCSLKVFSKIEGLDDIKEMMLRALESSERAHTLLTGSPASAKSLFTLQIEKFMRYKVYFAEGAATTKAGIQKFHCRKPR